MLKHDIAMLCSERLVCYFLSRFPNLKLTVHQGLYNNILVYVICYGYHLDLLPASFIYVLLYIFVVRHYLRSDR